MVWIQRLRNQVEDFKEYADLLQELANPALQSRHWEQVFEMVSEGQVNVSKQVFIRDATNILQARRYSVIGWVSAADNVHLLSNLIDVL